MQKYSNGNILMNVKSIINSKETCYKFVWNEQTALRLKIQSFQLRNLLCFVFIGISLRKNEFERC